MDTTDGGREQERTYIALRAKEGYMAMEAGNRDMRMVMVLVRTFERWRFGERP
jgi:hypothetical protein